MIIFLILFERLWYGDAIMIVLCFIWLLKVKLMFNIYIYLVNIVYFQASYVMLYVIVRHAALFLMSASQEHAF